MRNIATHISPHSVLAHSEILWLHIRAPRTYHTTRCHHVCSYFQAVPPLTLRGILYMNWFSSIIITILVHSTSTLLYYSSTSYIRLFLSSSISSINLAVFLRLFDCNHSLTISTLSVGSSTS